ncbi:MAG TPA: hypothetical protein VNW92_31835, partial [Polyangiaceae bacterium]|nr:hypothetical protein [Polyangiaceae bacterium]
PGALEFGFTGLVTGQNARLNFVNRSGGHGVPPGPCRASVAFLDPSGAHVLDSELDLAPLHGTSFELSASRVNANGAAAAVTSIRPVISAIGNPDLRPGSDEYPGMRPGSCLASFEIADQPGGASALRQDPAVIFGEQDTEL